MESARGDHGADEDLRFEYDHLRQEQLHNSALSIQILGGTLILIGTMMSFAFSEIITEAAIRALLFTFAGFITLLGMSFALNRRTITFIIASYLRVFLESESPNLRWETRISKLRGKVARYGHGGFTGNQLLIYGLFLFANIFFAAYYIFVGFSGHKDPISLLNAQDVLLPTSVILFALLVVSSILFYRRKNRADVLISTLKAGNNPVTFEGIWHEIKEEEKSGNAASSPNSGTGRTV